MEGGIVHPDIDQYILLLVQKQQILSANYQNTIKIFQDNKTLRQFIYDSIEEIIRNNFEGGEFSSDEIENLVTFITTLLKMKEVILAKRTIEIFVTMAGPRRRQALFGDLLSNVINSADADADTIENYLKLHSHTYSCPDQCNEDEIIWRLDYVLHPDCYTHSHSEQLNNKDYSNLLLAFFIASIRVNNKTFIDYVTSIWNNTAKDWEYRWFVDEMNRLMGQI